MKVILVDYGAGNLRSVRKALESVDADVIQTDDPEKVLEGDKVVLPGVGAFRDGMTLLRKRNLVSAINQVVERKMPLLGICLGMQLFFTRSSEMGDSLGLNYIQGEVNQFSMPGLKVPHTGWNQLGISENSSLFRNVATDSYVYFNHGFYCVPVDAKVTAASTEYGTIFPAAVQSGSIYGVQFHPEKSQDTGLTILKNFVEDCQ